MFQLTWSEYPDSAVRFHKTSALSTSNFEYGDSFLGFAQMKLKQTAKAESTFKRAELILGHRSPGLGVLYARTGRRHAALALLQEIDAAWPAAYIPPEIVAQIPAALGDTAVMYRWLERGVGVRSAWATLLGIWDPVLSLHRNEQHYQSIMRRVGVVAP